MSLGVKVSLEEWLDEAIKNKKDVEAMVEACLDGETRSEIRVDDQYVPVSKAQALRAIEIIEDCR